jgi:hypothetical protein
MFNIHGMNATVDACDPSKAKHDNQIMNFLIERIASDFKDYPIKCPFKKGTLRLLEVRTREMNREATLPPFIQSGQIVTLRVETFAVIAGTNEKLCTTDSSFKVQ